MQAYKVRGSPTDKKQFYLAQDLYDTEQRGKCVYDIHTEHTEAKNHNSIDTSIIRLSLDLNNLQKILL